MGLDNLFVIMKRGLYYRPEAKGYTSDINKAWKCTESVAKQEEYPHGDEPVTKHPAPIPNFDSLDVIHSLEETLNGDQIKFYVRTLKRIHPTYCDTVLDQRDPDGDLQSQHFELMHSTASQRRKAILKTLGKWKD